ncbi:hypothetical protein SAMN04487910_4550 [Aquimarina amphilecti]|uniref:Uncharacterized protein n=1 Tax=Aquimarina amphilecti TaxID=1038014 RepID=A0A1H7WVP6_AQUAM|nr:hypothetical protein [Aquimarina amphilecti]SEM25670.1 hypothetical protein SAMN04487910_4550 [Aquimarina amphilecti]
MKAYPAYLMLITFFSSGLLFSQQNVLIDGSEVSQHKIQETTSNNSKIIKKKATPLSITKAPLIDKAKTNNIKSKAISKTSNKPVTSIPRTTIDLF